MTAKKKKILDNPQKVLLNKFLISGLYTLTEPGRNDYAGMKIIDNKKYTKLSDEDKANGKYLVVQGRNKKKFHLGKKT